MNSYNYIAELVAGRDVRSKAGIGAIELATFFFDFLYLTRANLGISLFSIRFPLLTYDGPVPLLQIEWRALAVCGTVGTK